MARKPLIQARVEPEVKDAVEDYADTNDLTESEAVRRLMHKALKLEGYNVVGDRSAIEKIASPRTMRIATVLLVAGFGLLYGAYQLAKTGLNVVGVMLLAVASVVLLIGVLVGFAAVLAQLVLAKPLRGIAPLPWSEKA